MGKNLNDENEFLQQQKNKSLWIIKDYQVVLKSLLRFKNKNIPKLKNDLVLLHEEWKDRTPIVANEIGLSSIDTSVE